VLFRALGQINRQRDILRSALHDYELFVAERHWTHNVSKMKLQATVLLEIKCVFNGRQSDLGRDGEMKGEQP